MSSTARKRLRCQVPASKRETAPRSWWSERLGLFHRRPIDGIGHNPEDRMESGRETTAAEFAQQRSGSREAEPYEHQPPQTRRDRHQQERPKRRMRRCFDRIDLEGDAPKRSQARSPDTVLIEVTVGVFEH